jgi:uncharacterized protein HemX
MRFSEINETRIDELLPAVGAAIGGAANAVGGALARGAASAVGGMAKSVAPSAGGAQGTQQATSGQPPRGLDPAQAAMAAKEQQEKKKELQDAIKSKQAELQDLQKQLAQQG